MHNHMHNSMHTCKHNNSKHNMHIIITGIITISTSYAHYTTHMTIVKRRMKII